MTEQDDALETEEGEQTDTPKTPEEEQKEAERQFEILKQRMTRTS